MSFKKIDIEGCDSMGKSTLAKTYASMFGCHYSYEPDGSTPLSLQFRELALNGGEHEKTLDGIPREYLMALNRSISNKKNIQIMKGQNVISDRGLLSGMVYAHVDDKLNMSYDDWSTVHHMNAKTLLPDLIVHVTNKERRVPEHKRLGADIYDNRDDEFFKKISASFLTGLVYFERVFNVPHITFENTFDKTPEENAQRLASVLIPLLTNQEF